MRIDIGRLALRVESDNWVAYYAMPNTMEGAVWLGSIRMAIVQNPEHKQAFMNLMKAAIGDIIKEKTGGEVEFWNDPQPAPESERSGSE